MSDVSDKEYSVQTDTGDLSRVKTEITIERDSLNLRKLLKSTAVNKRLVSTRIIEAPSLCHGEEKKSFRAAPNNKEKSLKIGLNELIEFQIEILIKGNERILKLDEAEIEELKRKTIILKTFNPKGRKIKRMSEKLHEDRLTPISNNVEFITRGKQYGIFFCNDGFHQNGKTQFSGTI